MSSNIANGFALLANDPLLLLAPGLPDADSLLRLGLVAVVLLAGLLPAITASERRNPSPATHRA